MGHVCVGGCVNINFEDEFKALTMIDVTEGVQCEN